MIFASGLLSSLPPAVSPPVPESFDLLSSLYMCFDLCELDLAILSYSNSISANFPLHSCFHLCYILFCYCFFCSILVLCYWLCFFFLICFDTEATILFY